MGGWGRKGRGTARRAARPQRPSGDLRTCHSAFLWQVTLTQVQLRVRPHSSGAFSAPPPPTCTPPVSKLPLAQASTPQAVPGQAGRPWNHLRVPGTPTPFLTKPLKAHAVPRRGGLAVTSQVNSCPRRSRRLVFLSSLAQKHRLRSCPQCPRTAWPSASPGERPEPQQRPACEQHLTVFTAH